MTHQPSSALITSGRLLLALYFLVPGIMKFMQWDASVAYMETHNISFAGPLLLIAALANVLGALLLITNRYVRLTSLCFVLYIIIINLQLHAFWNVDAANQMHETQNFIKNLGILAGLLVLAGASVKRSLSFKGLGTSDSKIA
ncbi:MAG: DoxX family protein [Parvibaculaceae bacterium]|nr:DoxX family protein [Parvibaculaceae bacterium]